MADPVQLPSDRSFGLTFVVVFALGAGWLAWSGRPPGALLLAGASLLTLMIALTRPAILRPLNRAWMKFGALLHMIVSPLVLGTIFFLVFAPYGIVMRLRGRDALKLRFEPETRSYWVQREPPGPAPDSLTKQH